MAPVFMTPLRNSVEVALIYVSFILLLVTSVLGQRFQWFPFHISLGVLTLSILGLAGYSISQIKQTPMAAAGLIPFAICLFFAARGVLVPSVADVATRWEPEITYPLSTPENSQQTRTDIIAAAKSAYSHVKPLVVNENPEADIINQARDLGWRLIGKGESRLQYQVPTALMGYIDDVVVLWEPTESGYEVHVRSKSRVGKSDLGTNARRIESFLTQLSLRINT